MAFEMNEINSITMSLDFTNNMSFELTEKETTDNMSFELTEREIANNVSVEQMNFEPNNSTLKTFEMARECYNRLAKESYAKKIAHEINSPVIENSESTRERKNQLERETYARPNYAQRLTSETTESAENRRAKRLKVNHHASNTAHMKQYDSTTVNIYDLGYINIECIYCSTLHWKDEKVSGTLKKPVFSTCCAKGKNGVSVPEVHAELGAAEGSHTLSKRTIECWVSAFNNEDESVEDKPCPGRSHQATTQETIAKVENLVIEDPHSTTRELSDIVGISQAQITNILTNKLGMRKNGYRNVITGDETWIHYFTISNKQNNKQWVKKEESQPQIVRMARN
ncbi:22085_t:CDS:2, partial [Racocetra persica]